MGLDTESRTCFNGVMKRYERITYRAEGAQRSKTELFVVDAETSTFLLLTPVDAEGRDRSHYNDDGALVEVQHLISTELIRRRTPMKMNNHYGELEPS